MRLFLGIDLTKELKRELAQEIATFKTHAKGWEEPHDFHLTLLFIGAVSDQMIPLIHERMKQIDFTPFTLETNGYHFFSRRILYLGINEHVALSALREQVTSIFPEWSIKETKSYIPHITIKRWQRYEFDELKSNIERGHLKKYQLRVDRVTLFESRKDENNYKYHVVESIGPEPQ